ncbi:nuclear transport factor 2 family protein [Actinoplanes sp. TFC3]|uniref:nuclear transport factor 2 family protein n=1 Tax=Actinoplanes sp. TFC3 TaxID=1710355 RepID=UPI0008326C9D|nr:nuclear transport factor 2 family protein [Actinoplanes sp. TFC3]
MTSTAEVFVDCLHRLLSKDIFGFLSLMHPDCVMEFPFAPPGHVRILSTPAGLREYVSSHTRLFDIQGVNNLIVHETADPKTIVVEFSGNGTALATGHPFVIGFVAIFTTHDGLCLRYRDYSNPLTTLAVHGETAPRQ